MDPKLPGHLVMAQFLRRDLAKIDAVQIMLRHEPGKRRAPGELVIYLDGKEVARMVEKMQTRNGIPSSAHDAYDRMDEIAGYSLLDYRGHATDFDAAMAYGR